MKPPKTLFGPDPQINGARHLTTLDQLEAACTRMLKVPIRIYDEDIEIDVRLLLDNEREIIQRILEEVFPPLKKPEVAPKDAKAAVKPEYDLTDPGYQEKLKLHQRLARAVTLYLCVPMFAARFPDLMDRNAILEAVSSCKLTDAVLNALYAVALSEAQVEEQVNFTSPRAKTPSSARGLSARRKKKPRKSKRDSSIPDQD